MGVAFKDSLTVQRLTATQVSVTSNGSSLSFRSRHCMPGVPTWIIKGTPPRPSVMSVMMARKVLARLA